MFWHQILIYYTALIQTNGINKLLPKTSIAKTEMPVIKKYADFFKFIMVWLLVVEVSLFSCCHKSKKLIPCAKELQCILII